MKLNACLVCLLVKEFALLLRGKTVSQVRVRGSMRRMVLEVKDRETSCLSVDLTPGRPAAVLRQEVDPAEFGAAPGIWQKLQGAVITDVAQPVFDNILRLELELHGTFGEKTSCFFILHLFGTQPTGYLVGEDGVIRARFPEKVRDTRRSTDRYQQPGEHGGRNPFAADEGEIREFFSTTDRSDCAGALRSRFWGISDLVARELCSGFGGPAGASDVDAAAADFKKKFDMRHPPFRSVVVMDESGAVEDIVWFTPGTVPAGRLIEFDSINGALDWWLASQAYADRSVVLRRRIELVRRKLDRRRQALLGDLQKYSGKDFFRKAADGLKTLPDKSSRGQREVEVIDFESPEGKKLTVKLDPARSILENMEQYYKDHRKAVAGEKKVRQLIAEIEKAQQTAAELASALAQSVKETELDALEKRITGLEERSGVPARGARLEKKRVPAERLFKWVKSPSGFDVVAGTNSKQNYALTFGFAGPEDLWFHAWQSPGGHVILRVPSAKTEIPMRDIEYAARVAAYLSRQKHSAKVDVVYTRVKYVRKPRKGKVGQVLYRNEKSIMVEPLKPDGG